MSKYTPGNVSEKLELGALGALTAISQIFNDTVPDTMRCTSLKATYALQGFTPGSDDGPIMVGVAHSDYTTAEIEAWIELINSWDFGDLSQREVTERLIRKIGIFENPTLSSASTTLNDGKPIRTRLNWLLREGQSLRLWAYNLGESILTSSPEVLAQGKANLWRE